MVRPYKDKLVDLDHVISNLINISQRLLGIIDLLLKPQDSHEVTTKRLEDSHEVTTKRLGLGITPVFCVAKYLLNFSSSTGITISAVIYRFVSFHS
jgi:hypothetical protein